MSNIIRTWQDRFTAWVRPWLARMTSREKAILAALCIILIVSGTLSVVGFIDSRTHLIPQFGGTYREAAIGQPRYLNPILASSSDLDSDISRLVYSSLFKLDNNFQLQNDLATEYSLSSDQRTYTIKIRPDVSWHDGQPLTADDVVFTIRSIQTPDYGSALISSFQGVQVDKVDDHTVTFTLKQPYAPFLTNLTVGIVPRHVWENIQPKNASLAEQMLKPVGSGPLKFSEISTRRRTGEITTFRLTRHEGYYGQRPYLDQIVFYFYTTHEEALQTLLAGKVDGIGFLPLSLADQAKSYKSVMVEQLLLPQYTALFFNQIKNDILSDAGVRAALALAVDREKIIRDALGDEAEPLSVPITSGFFTFDNLPQGSFDIAKAKQNLEEAGWQDTDGDGVREKKDKRLALKIATTDWPELTAAAEIVKENWTSLGAQVDIEQFGPGTIQQTIISPRDYEILLYGEILPAQPDPYPFWHSTQIRAPGLNLALFKDAKVDKLLEEARQTSDDAVRKEKYTQFLERIIDLNPAVILYQPYYLFAHDNHVLGNTMTRVNLPAGRFNDIANWHVKTKRVWGTTE